MNNSVFTSITFTAVAPRLAVHAGSCDLAHLSVCFSQDYSLIARVLALLIASSLSKVVQSPFVHPGTKVMSQQ